MKIISFVLFLTIIECAISEHLELTIDGPCQVGEGDKTVVYNVARQKGEGYCIHSVSNNKSVEIMPKRPVNFNENHSFETYILKIIDDKIEEPDEKIVFFLYCTDNGTNTPVRFFESFTIRDDDSVPFVSQFSTRVMAHGSVFNGSIFNLIVEAVSGTGTCSLATSNKNVIMISKLSQAAKHLEFSQMVSFQLFAISHPTVEGNDEATLKLTCIDDKDGSETTLFYPTTVIHVTDTSMVETSFTFSTLMSQSVMESEKLSIIILRRSGSASCRIVLDSSVGKLLTSGQFILNGNISQAVQVIKTHVSIKHMLTRKEHLDIECTDISDNSTYKERRQFYITKIPGIGSSIVGDPHFIQSVYDDRKKSLKSICYDISGNSGDTILILKQNSKNGMSVYGQLKDDYYMHSIKIISRLGNVTFDTETIHFSNGASLKWDNFVVEMLYFVGNYSVIFKKNRLQISYLYGNARRNSIEVIIVRSNHQISGYFLDISFNGISNNYYNTDGLLGRIGKNNFRFYNSVQRGKGNYIDQNVAVTINGHLITGRIVERNSVECWLLSIKDLLISNTVSDFITSDPSDLLKLVNIGPSEVAESDDSIVYNVKLLSGRGKCTSSLSSKTKVQISGVSPTEFYENNIEEYYIIHIKDNSIPESDLNIIFRLDCIDESNGQNVTFEKLIIVKDDDILPYKSPFLMQVNFVNNILEGHSEIINIFTVKGSGFCRVFSLNRRRLRVIYGKEQLYTKNSLKYIGLYAERDSNFENIVVFIRLDCLDLNNKKQTVYELSTTILKYQILIVNEPFTAGFIGYVDVNEGQVVDMIFHRIKGYGRCEMNSPSIPDVEIVGPTKFDMQETNFQYFQFEALYNNADKNDRKCTIEIQCQDLHSTDTTSLSLNVLIRNSDIQATGDPHIKQRVFDQREKALKMICYDVYGQAGDVILLIRELTEENLSVYGKLMDDCYMHIVKLTSTSGNITLTTDQIIFPDHHILKWDDFLQEQTLYKGNYCVILKKDLMNISKIQDNFFHQSFKIIIKRSHRPTTGYFLDVAIKGINEQYIGIDGLLGRIGKNNFKFYESVQEERDLHGNLRVSIEVNGRIGTARIDNRGGTDCWLLNVKDALYPSSLNDYVFSYSHSHLF
ncbi:DgyrCDS8601 [Dimorphilus gyrociliatus]|uniref:DgyrCDS8601 n=1 Tax=Dimorphilus gyrociliatus TaxID=2664684 RepID=A0A7I8VW39_9ANNE|nr:DgyrCDS8601 [Dimorphilus gyrociliatus]